MDVLRLGKIKISRYGNWDNFPKSQILILRRYPEIQFFRGGAIIPKTHRSKLISLTVLKCVNTNAASCTTRQFQYFGKLIFQKIVTVFEFQCDNFLGNRATF